MSLKTSQYKQICQFLTCFTIQQHSPGTTVISSQQNTFLIRDIQISPPNKTQSSQQLDQIINTLYQHQTLSSKNILSLIDFDIIYNSTKTQTQIRAVYEYGKKSLSKQIQQRKLSQQHFDQQALWGLVYSITSPLAYLQEKNIIYGVIDPSRVFLDKNIISILDPSSTGIDPYEIMSNRLYSPELLNKQRCIEEIEMFKSDVYVLGLMMLQCALLKMDLYSYDENVISMCLSEIKDIYSESLCQLIESMLDSEPEERQSFEEILKSISNLFDISTSQVQTLQPIAPDAQDQSNQMCELDEFSQREIIDILQTEYIRYDEHYQGNIQRAQYNRFGSASRDSEFSESMIEEASEYSETSSLCLEDSVEKSFEKSRRIYKPKQIKDKLITQDYALHSERAHLHSQRNNLNSQRDHSHSQIDYTHARSKTIWQQMLPIPHQQLHKQRFLKPSKQDQSKHTQQSKQNQLPKNNITNIGSYSPLNKENLFTKPEIMKMIKNDIKRIEEKKKTGLSVHFSYFSQEENKHPKKDNTPIVHGYSNRK